MMGVKNEKIAILCNGVSSAVTDRVELIAAIHNKNLQPYTVGIDDGTLNSYYNENNSIFIPVIASRNNTNPINEIKSIISVKQQIMKHKIDYAIIYGVKNHPAMTIGCKLGKTKRIICVVNGSGNLFRVEGKKGVLLRMISFPMLRLAYSMADLLCFQNEDDIDLFRRKHLIKQKTEIFLTKGSGVNLDKFPKTNIPDNGSVLFLSRITPSKGLSDFIDAAYLVRDKGYSISFDIVGPIDGAVENDPDQKLQRAVKDGVVIYHGETKNVSNWMSKARIFVYPSYYPEGVPRCVLQALATGRPIITCNTPGCKVTVDEGVNGFLVEPHDPEDIANKIIMLMNDPDQVYKMGEASRLKAEKEFDVNKINEILLSKLLSEK